MRIAGPARRMGHLRGDAARRAQRLAGRGDRPHREQAFVDRRHLGAVGRPDRTAAAARVDRQVGLRRVPLVVAALRRHGQDLVGAFAEPRRVGRHHADGDARAVGGPGGIAGREQRLVNARDLAGRHIHDRDRRPAPHAVHVEEGDAGTVGRPGRALRLGRELASAGDPGPSPGRGSTVAAAVRPCRTSRPAGVPSGDHAGSVSRKRSLVMFSAAPPTGITQISPTAANATLVPSGESTGRTMPSTLRGVA